MMTSTRDTLVQLKSWLSRQRPKVTLLAIGFAIGATVVGIRSCVAPGPGAERAALSAAASGGGETKETIWTCSMHPQIRQPEPGQCPICGMDLIPVSSDGDTESDTAGRIVLSERAKALAKLRTTPVRRSTGAADVRLLGRVEVDETTLKTITAWTGGRIDRLDVSVTGELVRSGQVIATLYSPEVFAAHQDLLVAKRQVSRIASGAESARSAAAAALDAARERMRLLGVPEDELARMERKDRPTTAVPIRTPFGGTVIDRLVSEGAYVTTGAPLYRIADLDSLWIQLDAYESDLPSLAVGQQVRIEAQSLPDGEFEGEVAFIDPTLDSRRRTSRVRVKVNNRDGRLKPGMFAQAVVAAETEEGANAPLVVPSTAPLFTGRRALVYVEVASGDLTAYEPRTVRLGPRLGDFYPVVAGLSEGERIVTRGAFALDADLQIRGGASMMMSPDDLELGPWDAAIDVPRDDLRQLSPVVIAYLSVQRALAADDVARAHAAAIEMERAVSNAKIERPHKTTAAWAEISRSLSGHARHVAHASSIEDARMDFEGLSDGIAMMLRIFGNPLDQPLVQAHCPMAFGSRGASWVQQGEKIDNSYFGESMRTCGEVVQRVDPGSHLPMSDRTPSSARDAARAGGHQH